MNIQSICPSLYNISYFKYADGRSKYPKISFEKSQYVYRVLLIEQGSLEVFMRGKVERLEAGDALYLLPGEVYRLLPSEEAFSLYNLFFNFCDESNAYSDKYNYCIFKEQFDRSLCLPKIDFENAPVLNRSGIFKNIFLDKKVKSLLYMDRSDAIYSFCARSILFSIIANMLTAARKIKGKSSAVLRILQYIRSNPEKDLSASALSKLFSYHKNHINKLIKQETGKSLSEYIRYVKIEYAKTLLSEELCSTSEVVIRLGYYDYSHFYKAFLLETGTRPTEYLPVKK
jgi:AraC-like DNA-binding protein